MRIKETLPFETPARQGVENAIDELLPLISANVEGAIILVTDGAANCRSGVTGGSELLEVFDLLSEDLLWEEDVALAASTALASEDELLLEFWADEGETTDGVERGDR